MAAGSKSAEKKARQRARKEAERAAGRELDQLAEVAVDKAIALAPEVAEAADRISSERAVDITIPTVDAARFIHKRINAALAVGEWLDEVEAWVWIADQSTRPPLTESGSTSGIEVRLEQPGRG